MSAALPDLRRLYSCGLTTCHGHQTVFRHACTERLQNAHVLAIGKAAAAMSRGLLAAARARHETLASLLVISRDEPPLAEHETVDCVQGQAHMQYGDHPLPGALSLQAGAAAFAFVRAIPAGRRLIVLLSGGASALCEHLQPGRSLSGLQAATAAGLAQGLGIAALNQQRRQWSQLKGGGLRRAAHPGVRVQQFLIADVPGADPAVVGSAPFLDDNLPTDTQVIASPAHFEQAIREASPNTRLRTGNLNGELSTVASALLEALPGPGEQGPGELGLWQGEATTPLPAKSGQGGRAQHLALYLALRAPPAYEFLVAATDGSDGNTDAAGVYLHAARIAHVQQHREQAERALAHADSHRFWREHGGLLYTGATGTNVMDVVMAQFLLP